MKALGAKGDYVLVCSVENSTGNISNGQQSRACRYIIEKTKDIVDGFREHRGYLKGGDVIEVMVKLLRPKENV